MEAAHPVKWPHRAQAKSLFDIAQGTTSPRVRCAGRLISDSLNSRRRNVKFESLKLWAQLVAGTAIACSTAALGQTVLPTASVFTQRVQWIAAFEGMPQAALHAYFLRCEAASRGGLLVLDDAIRCAMAWDALLKRDFNGDVEGLLAWWRKNRHLQPTP